MSCGDAMGMLLSKYVDNDLSPQERARVEGHLAGCAACKELLSVFMRNESMLSNALAREAFCETVVDKVLDRIDGETPKAEPVKVSRWEALSIWLRERPWLQLATAAALLVALVLFFTISRARRDADLNARVIQLDDQVKHLEAMAAGSCSESQQQLKFFEQALADRRTEYISLRIRAALNSAPDGQVVGYFSPEGLAVATKFFNPGRYVGYKISRSEDNRAYHLLEANLQEPAYLDRAVKPDSLYYYKFAAVDRKGEEHESAPIPLRTLLPGGLDPEKYLKIRCIGINPENNVARFFVTRTVNHVEVIHEFIVPLGQSVGRPVEKPGFGTVDFTTGLTFSDVESGEETLQVTFATIKLHPDSNEPIYDNEHQVAFDLVDRIISQRKNQRALLTAPGTQIKIWKDSSTLVEAKK